MKLGDLLNHQSEWLRGTGPNSNIVISSRIRLARNLSKYPFPHWANKKSAEEVMGLSRQAIKRSNFLKSTSFLKLSELDSLDKQFLIERHLMSPELAVKADSKALAVSEEEIVSIMINEEDHIRLQVMKSGFDMQEAWDITNRIDNELAKKIPFAFSTDWGYLTACPTNTGTGMRGSVMLHLPALVMTKQINRVLSAISKLSFTTRGLYGEGTEAAGNFFQISNQVALGHSEEEIIGNIKAIIRQIIEQEQQARDLLFSQHRSNLEDKIFRALGLLRSAYIMTSQETVELLSMVRLGLDFEIMKGVDRSFVNELFITTQPAHLQKIEGKRLNAQERDKKRASLIRNKLKL